MSAAKRIVSPAGKPKTLAAVHPNAGLTQEYQRRLDRLLGEMHRSISYFVLRAYSGKPPEMAQDAPDGSAGMSPARFLEQRMRELGKRWLSRFDDAAPELAKYFAKAAADRSDVALKDSLRRAGISVKFRMTREVNDIAQASVAENVNLIRSIAQQHMTQVQTLVMSSVQTGRDIGTLAKALQDQYGVTRRRAALIARDQNSKATAAITRARQIELGITEAVWLHSTAGRHPRPSHVAASGKRYDIAKGMYLDGVWTWPGREINCRCVSKSIVSGFD